MSRMDFAGGSSTIGEAKEETRRKAVATTGGPMSEAATRTRNARGEAPRYDMDAFRREIGDVPLIDDERVVRLRSRDFFWYSPVLNEQLHGLSADIIAVPRDEADVVRVARACARARSPLTPRGGGTANYGQAVPLAGGVLLDLTELNAIEWHKPGVLRAGAGAKMVDIDMALKGH